MIMKLIVHADDFGNTVNITDDIMDCFQGSLMSTSIIANGHAFDYAVAQFKRLKNKRLAIHINLLEGRPVAKQEDVKLLVNSDGFFKFSFFKLLLFYYTSRKEVKEELCEQIGKELIAQFDKVSSVSPGGKIYVDSHQHFHMLPFVFKAVLNLKDRFDIQYIRIPQERFFVDFKIGALKNYFGLNIVKHLLLNYLSKICRRYLSETGISSPDYFIGVLFTGRMTVSSIKKALSKINGEKNTVVEILLHPGGLANDEAHMLSNYPELINYYSSSCRRYEKQVLQSEEFLNLFNKYERDQI